MNSTRRLGWIGLGKMGTPMAARLLEAGHGVEVYDVSPDACHPLRDAGASVAYSAQDVVQAADIVFTSLPNDDVLRRLLVDPDGIVRHLAPGKIIVETSTVSPAASAEAAQVIEATGAAYIRSPISGSTATAVAGKLTVLASGPRDAYEAVRPVMEAFASRFFHVGTGEEARTLKLVLNMLVGATSALLAEALTFGQKGNLEVRQMLEVITESVVGSPLIGYKREMLERHDFTPAFTVQQMIKDFDLIIDAARSFVAPVYLTALIRQQYEAANAQGLAEQDFFALLQQYEAQAGLLQTPRPANP